MNTEILDNALPIVNGAFALGAGVVGIWYMQNASFVPGVAVLVLAMAVLTLTFAGMHAQESVEPEEPDDGRPDCIDPWD